MFLIDANCWMQLVRSRPHAGEVRAFLAAVPSNRLFVTDFAVSSIALNMERRNQLKEFSDFLESSTIGTDIAIIRLGAKELATVVDTAIRLGLDFDDAYQYVAAELNDLALVSLDADFDRTPRGRLTPAAALQQFKDESSQPAKDS